MSDITVLFILGKGRSGSTLLDNILGQVDGVFTTGELVHLWDWGYEQGVRCGCGDPVLECPVWSEVLTRVLRSDVVSSHDDALALQRAAVRWHRLPGLLAGRRGRGGPVRRWLELEAHLYAAIRDVTGCRVIVDASKVPYEPALHLDVDGVDPRFLHLVRDPRAVSHSWRRTKVFRDREGGSTMSRHSAAQSATSWLARNLVVEAIRLRRGRERFLRTRYEDLTAGPHAELTRILEHAGADASGLPAGDTFPISENHTVGGNPDRSGRDQIVVREDVEWRDELSPADAWVTTAIGTPLLRRYGYPWRARRTPAPPEATP